MKLKLPRIGRRKKQLFSNKIASPPPSDEKIVQSDFRYKTEKETLQDSYTGFGEATPNYTPVRSTPVAPSHPAPLNQRYNPTKSHPVKTSSTATMIVFSIISIVLIKLFYLTGAVHAAECVPTSTLSSSGPIIAIMGATGTGKSSFIRDLQGRDSKGCLPKVGHGMQSCKGHLHHNFR
jgi:hypothetical protein